MRQLDLGGEKTEVVSAAPADRGFIPVDRELFESELFRSFTAQQRAVVLELYGLANWSPRPFFHRGERIDVGRGELAHSLRTIAERIPGCSKDIVDGVVRTLQREGFLIVKQPTAKPTATRVLRLRRYVGNGGDVPAHPTPDPTASRQPADSRADAQPTERRGEERQDRREESAAAAPPALPQPKANKADDEESAQARAVREMAARVFEELRGAPYQLATKGGSIANAHAARALAGLAPLEEVERRWREALATERPRIDTLADLARFWARFSPPPAVARARAKLRPHDTERALAEAAEACPEWGSTLERLQRPDIVTRWLAPLRPRMEGAVLVLGAPDEYCAAFLGDNYLPMLRTAARREVRVEVVEVAAMALGEAAAR